MTDLGVRQGSAALVVLLYLALCGAIAWRERRHHRKAAADIASLSSARNGTAAVLVAYASQTGYAEELAWATARLLHAAGEAVDVLSLQHVDAARLASTGCVLFIVSTSGEGDPPDVAAHFVRRTMAATANLSQLQYGLLSLGDRQYARYCAFGRLLDDWLRAQQARPLFECVEVDNADPVALTQWQQRLGTVASLSELPAWPAPTNELWTLRTRRQLNPGSVGQAVFHLELAAPPDRVLDWESGDLVQVVAPADPEHPREYSISSIPQDGTVHLLVRQELRSDGQLGVASGWLTQGADTGSVITLRLRAHRNFRLEENRERPLILVGNGTGLAGLRSHLKMRAALGQCVNWLMFGERNAAHDFLYRDELQAWQTQGLLHRLDMAFSRDQSQRRYVQDLLAEAAAELRQWVTDGAAIYVCGSLTGMATGVDTALRQILGEREVDLLLEAGRYRRDVY